MPWEQLRPLLWYLVSIILIVGAAWWVMHWLSHKGGGTGLLARSPQRLRLTVLARTPVGKDQYLLVVQAGERYLLLGSAPGGLTTLAELSEDDMAALRAPEPGTGEKESAGFSQLLRQLAKNKESKGGRDV